MTEKKSPLQERLEYLIARQRGTHTNARAWAGVSIRTFYRYLRAEKMTGRGLLLWERALGLSQQDILLTPLDELPPPPDDPRRAPRGGKRPSPFWRAE